MLVRMCSSGHMVLLEAGGADLCLSSWGLLRSPLVWFPSCCTLSAKPPPNKRWDFRYFWTLLMSVILMSWLKLETWSHKTLSRYKDRTPHKAQSRRTAKSRAVLKQFCKSGGWAGQLLSGGTFLSKVVLAIKQTFCFTVTFCVSVIWPL